MAEGLLLVAMGLAIGVAVAAPVGSVGILVIRRALAERPWAGFVAGLGGALGDAIFAAIAGFGVTTVTQALHSWQRPLRIGGGLVLIAMGLALLAWSRRSHRLPGAAASDALLGKRKAFLAALALTLTNPVTALSFVAIFAAAGLSTGEPSFADTAVLVAAVFAGSALWFLLLSRSAYAISQRCGERAARVFDAGAALLLIVLGLVALLAPGR